MRNKERRWVTTDVRYGARDDENSNPVVTGHPIMFNKWTVVGDYFREIIRPGVSKKTIKEADIRALQNHDPNYVLARRAGKDSDTLRLKEDGIGLASEMDIAPTTFGKDLLISMKRGDINQMSFGFEVVKEEWRYPKEKMPERELLEIKLFDVSIVTFPQYPEASAQVRAALDIEGFGNLTDIFFRMRQGMKLSNADMEMLNQHIEFCRSHIGSSEEPVASHSDDNIKEPMINHSMTDAGKERLRKEEAERRRKIDIEIAQL